MSLPKPTPGRTVLYRPSPKEDPLPAVITAATSDEIVDLVVFNARSIPSATPRLNVRRGKGAGEWAWPVIDPPPAPKAAP